MYLHTTGNTDDKENVTPPAKTIEVNDKKEEKVLKQKLKLVQQRKKKKEIHTDCIKRVFQSREWIYISKEFHKHIHDPLVFVSAVQSNLSSTRSTAQ